MKWSKCILLLIILGIGGYLLHCVGVEFEAAFGVQGYRATNAAFGLVFTVIFLFLALFIVIRFLA